MKHPRIWATIIALVTPPLVGKPVYHAIFDGGTKTPSIESVEAATSPSPPMAQTASVRMPSMAMAPIAVDQRGPTTEDIARCKKALKTVTAPKRQSITDDMEPKLAAEINTANARILAGLRCLNGLR